MAQLTIVHGSLIQASLTFSIKTGVYQNGTLNSTPPYTPFEEILG
jgi:hypothetical protein